MTNKKFLNFLWIVPGFLIAAYSLRLASPKPQMSSAAYPPPIVVFDSQSAYPPPSGDNPVQSAYPPPGDDGEGEPQPPREGSISDAAMKALDYIADRNGIPIYCSA